MINEVKYKNSVSPKREQQQRGIILKEPNRNFEIEKNNN